MISREEKNKVYVDEIKKEQTIFLSKKILKITFILITSFSLLFLYIYFIGPSGLKTNEFIIKNDAIPKSFYGVKILHFTDILYGKTINQDDLTKLENEIKKINPDLVFFTGNMISKDYNITETDLNLLKNFFTNIPYTMGKYAVKGNTDNHNLDLVMENTNFHLLNNEIIKIYNKKNEYIEIIGLNDNEIKDLSNNSNTYSISLINNFDKYYEYNISSNLVLAGNNLGGEISLFGEPILGNNKYNKSYYNENNMNIYISSGLGTIHHMRLFNKPSINVFRIN